MKKIKEKDVRNYMKCRNFNIENNNVNDSYFKSLVIYNAKTEMYDRSLNDMRSRYDHTGAYIVGDIRSKSNSYAFRLYSILKQYIETKTNKFDIYLWNDLKRNYSCYSSQHWIDIYNDLRKYDTEIKNIEMYIDANVLYTKVKIIDYESHVQKSLFNDKFDDKKLFKYQ